MGHSGSERAARMAPPLSWRFPSPRGGADRLHRGLLACASRGGMSGLRHLGPSVCAGPALMGLVLLAFAALGAAPAQAQTVTTLVSNTDLGFSVHGVAQHLKRRASRRAATTVPDLRFPRSLIRGVFTPTPTPPDNSSGLRIDDGGEAGRPGGRLDEPGHLHRRRRPQTRSRCTARTRLDPETTYWVTWSTRTSADFSADNGVLQTMSGARRAKRLEYRQRVLWNSAL